MLDALIGWFEAHPGTAGWAQAVGVVGAVIVAILVPALQERHKTLSERAARARETKEHLRRLVTGLRAELTAASEAMERQQTTANRTLAQLEIARQAGRPIADAGPIAPGSLVITDAVIYRALASDLGHLRPEVIRELVNFYSYALEIPRIAEMATTAVSAYETISSMAPRVRMSAAMLQATLDKWQQQDLRADAEIKPQKDEILALAAQAGYPIRDIARERGLEV